MSDTRIWLYGPDGERQLFAHPDLAPKDWSDRPGGPPYVHPGDGAEIEAVRAASEPQKVEPLTEAQIATSIFDMFARLPSDSARAAMVAVLADRYGKATANTPPPPVPIVEDEAPKDEQQPEPVAEVRRDESRPDFDAMDKAALLDWSKRLDLDVDGRLREDKVRTLVVAGYEASRSEG